MPSAAAPMKTARIAALSMAWAWAIVSSGTGLNALIESNRSQRALIAKVPPPTVVTINVSDATNSGIALTTGSLLIGILTYNFVAGMFLPWTAKLTNRTLKLQACALSFCCIWLFACAVPFTYIYNTRSAIVRAFVGGVELPHSVIVAVEKQSGTSSVYKTMGYLRWVAIFPWITLLFTAIAAFVLFKASHHVLAPEPEVAPAREEMKEKASVEHLEKPSV
ncbi:hypothetical protein FPV67DRAFT_1495413 [Lyophyllum atratum]|nr:hypothetical protein FPV67DRAFT_1495413 [Lyophyllum atratum]